MRYKHSRKVGLAHHLAILCIGLILATTTGQAAAAEGAAERVSARFASCGAGVRVTCVVDGDTFWLNGEKIRIADINTPETHGAGCVQEALLGDAATRRLTALLNNGPFTLAAVARDTDRYGRLLRIVTRKRESLGARLVSEGLAEPWRGRRRNWC